jgi:dienelactone hydrolase
VKGKSTGARESAYLLVCFLLGITGFLGYAMSKFIPGKLIVIITGIGGLGFLAALLVMSIKVKKPAAIARDLVISLLVAGIGGYAILFSVVFFLQDTIANQTSSFFQPQGLAAGAEVLASSHVEDIDLTTPDGTRLRGWLVHNADPGTPAPLLIYFDGSGSEVSRIVPYARQLEGWSVALVNYRGFGLSEGVPSQAHALVDATFLYDTFAQRPDVDADHIAAMGYSLGTGVAVYLSDERPVAGTVLVSPYDQWSLIGVQRSPVYAPLAGILKPYFDSLSRAPQITTPVLCLIGAEDTTIPPELSFRLMDAWGGKTTVKTYPGEDHGLLLHDNSSWTDIADFLHTIQ